MPVFLAALLNAEKSMAPIAPDPTLSTAQDFLRMVRGQRAGTVFEKALDTYLATITDHGFNASTFTARVVASTHAGLISSVLAALCALEGPAAWRRARPGARHAGRDRRGVAGRGVVRRRLRQGHDA